MAEDELRMKQWDPTKNVVNVGGITPRAYADGSMVRVEFDKPKRTKHMGATGQGRHAKVADRSGRVIIRLAGYSPTVAGFSALDILDVPYAIAIVDKASNGDSFFAASCTLTQDPPMDKGEEEEMVEYIYQFIRGRIYRAGAEADGLIAALTGVLPGF